jgi:hypothetical protein
MHTVFSAGPKPKHWFSFVDGSETTWEVFIGDEKNIPQLDGVEGITLPQLSLIAIEGGQDVDRMRIILGHEMLHACMSLPGDLDAMAHLLNCTNEEVRDIEERIVGILAPRLFGILIRNGFLKFPKLPK